VNFVTIMKAYKRMERIFHFDEYLKVLTVEACHIHGHSVNMLQKPVFDTVLYNAKEEYCQSLYFIIGEMISGIFKKKKNQNLPLTSLHIHV
jgi:hypothetical protein